MKKLLITLFIICISSHAFASNKEGRFVQKNNLFPRVKIITSEGDIIVELDRSRSPLTVNNFLTYVVNGDYKNSVFHRIEKDQYSEIDEFFVIQGGGYDKDYDGLFQRKPIFNESGNGLKNDMYTIAMAYQDNEPHTATRQFFFNMKDNDHLNPGRGWGFAVFGNVMEGYETLDKITQVETGFNEKIGYDFVPKKPVMIYQVEILKAEAL
ncbi:peptidylprolyl isomerase [Pseudoalteromonas phenolica]|jgi:peptidyl-prolyl cis-trans isomerase A (cyclophilin A)|uniref:peptidylprolyl isomerase n=1 Tax=Pseudoalteromonas phenolica TaxID=161398 RepID=A0A0S2K586_9GAMM|nr:peptidylprolyl isomerase [Pseudoalteromonas phenolica]ALO43221.1 Peptidyl-prolyl cis-trans isomerase (Rotamase)-cyclophilin family [Pseudoalteromonas phenolica]MBE0355626.1 peptidyl-prolyl cis-trans isomerase A (cyclophilin A) [Pseudoalteromonas phenolica O-BC30]TMO56177.1 peptidylprolyl isomerase [Pseudoalteromonas phenolica]